MRWEVVPDDPVPKSIMSRLFILLNRARSQDHEPVSFVVGNAAWHELMAIPNPRAFCPQDHSFWGIPLVRSSSLRDNDLVALNIKPRHSDFIITSYEPKEQHAT